MLGKRSRFRSGRSEMSIARRRSNYFPPLASARPTQAEIVLNECSRFYEHHAPNGALNDEMHLRIPLPFLNRCAQGFNRQSCRMLLSFGQPSNGADNFLPRQLHRVFDRHSLQHLGEC